MSGNFNVAAAEPSTLTAVPVFVPSLSDMLMFLAVPHFAVVIAAEPSNDVPFIFTAVFIFVAVAALPLHVVAVVAVVAVAVAVPLTVQLVHSGI